MKSYVNVYFTAVPSCFTGKIDVLKSRYEYSSTRPGYTIVKHFPLILHVKTSKMDVSKSMQGFRQEPTEEVGFPAYRSGFYPVPQFAVHSPPTIRSHENEDPLFSRPEGKKECKNSRI